MPAISENPYLDLRDQLAAAAAGDDTAALSELLDGRHLPLVGVDPWPAESLHRALAVHPFDPELTSRVCALTAQLVTSRFDKLTHDLEHNHFELEDEGWLSQLFLFIRDLPRDAILFEALAPWARASLRAGVSLSPAQATGRRLLMALAQQQTDDRLESFWLDRLHAPSRAASAQTFGPVDQERLLAGWRGLAWVSTSDSASGDSQAEADRWVRGLRLLDQAVQDQPQAPQILHHALGFLADSHPRSPELWQKTFAPLVDEGSDELVEALVQRWPDFESLFTPDEEADSLNIPESLADIWAGLSEFHGRIQELSSGKDPAAWKTFWTTELLFLSAPEGLTAAQWRSGQQELRTHFEKLASLTSNPDEPSLEELAAQEARPDSPRAFKKRRRGAFESLKHVQQVQVQIENRLRAGDLPTASKYLDELVDEQEKEGVEGIHIAKTLCRAAALGVEKGHLEWAIELYNRAQHKNDSDPVVHNGLAEAHKAKGNIDEAIRIYEKAAKRWTDNPVAQTGLAEAHKAKGNFDEAIRIYQNAAKRWTDNPVAQNGLAEAYKAKGNIDEAIRIYERIAKRWTDDPVAQNGLAEAYKAKGNIDRALEIYERVLKQRRDDRVTRNGLANVLRLRKQFSDALDILPHHNRIQGLSDTYDLHLRGVILLEQGRFIEARETFTFGVRESPKVWRDKFYAGLMLVDLRQKDYAKALESAKELNSQRTEYKVLEFHASAGAQHQEDALRLKVELERITLSDTHAKKVVDMIDREFRVSEGPLRMPPPEVVEDLFQAELAYLDHCGFTLAA